MFDDNKMSLLNSMQAGDLLLVKTTQRLSPDQREETIGYMREQMRANGYDNPRILLADEGLQIERFPAPMPDALILKYKLGPLSFEQKSEVRSAVQEIVKPISEKIPQVIVLDNQFELVWASDEQLAEQGLQRIQG